MKKVFFGLHIPKCAGTSVLSELKRCYGNDLYQSTSLISNFREAKPDLTDSYKNLNYAGYFGHHFCDELLKLIGDKIFLFTFLRDPLDRALSHYKYINRMNAAVNLPKVEFEEFLASLPSITKFIVQRFPGLIDAEEANAPRWVKAASILKKFDYVGESDNLASFQNVFLREFGERLELNVVKNKAPIENDYFDYNIRETVFRSLEEDILLYRWYKEFWESARRLSTDASIKEFVRSPFKKDRFLEFHARSLIQEFKANNELDFLRNFKFSNEDFGKLLLEMWVIE